MFLLLTIDGKRGLEKQALFTVSAPLPSLPFRQRYGKLYGTTPRAVGTQRAAFGRVLRLMQAYHMLTMKLKQILIGSFRFVNRHLLQRILI
jgi:hypothetical protein